MWTFSYQMMLPMRWFNSTLGARFDICLEDSFYLYIIGSNEVDVFTSVGVSSSVGLYELEECSPCIFVSGFVESHQAYTIRYWFLLSFTTNTHFLKVYLYLFIQFSYMIYLRIFLDMGMGEAPYFSSRGMVIFRDKTDRDGRRYAIRLKCTVGIQVK